MVQCFPFVEKATEQALQGATESDLADQGQDQNDGQGRTGQQHGCSHAATPVVVRGQWGHGDWTAATPRRGSAGGLTPTRPWTEGPP